MTDTSPASSLRCAPQARAGGYRPAGTAATATAFVLVETPLPWPGDVADHPLLRPVAPVVASHGARLQAVVPQSASTDGGAGRAEARAIRVIVYRQPRPGTPAVGPYVRRERVTSPDRLPETVAALLADTRDDETAAAPTIRAAGSDGVVHDVLVCTHGSRDVCCGRDGVAVHRDLVAMDLPGVRVWRTSHTGGHRFAPTVLTFPDGRAWASVDAALVAGIVTRSVDPGVAARHDRGCAALGDPFLQAADGAVLGVEGWSWLDHPRSVTTVETAASGNGHDHRTLTVTGSRDGSGPPQPVAYRAEVAVRRVVPVPDCGRPLEEARKTSTEVEVVALEPVRPPAPPA